MKRLHVVEFVDSTNAELARRLPLPDGFGLMARTQSSGRGRQGRSWLCLPGDLAVSFWLPTPPQPVTALPLVAGLAVLDALAAHGLAARCKWPNDIRVRGKKMAGLLASLHRTPALAPSAEQNWGVILGIGINLAGEASRNTALDRPVTSFQQETGRVLPPEILFGTLALRLARRLRRWRSHGFAPHREDWLALCDHLHADVGVHTPGGTIIRGRTCGLGPCGELLLECEGTIRTLLCGDVE